MADWGAGDDLVEEDNGDWGANDAPVVAPRSRGLQGLPTGQQANPADARRAEPAGLLSRPGVDPAADPMLRPEFVQQVRSELAGIDPEARIPALRQAASGNGVRARAARELLRQAERENARILPQDEELARLPGATAFQGRVASGGKLPPRPEEAGVVPLPEPTPSVRDLYEGVQPKEVAARRMVAAKIAEQPRPSMDEAKGIVAKQRVERPGIADDTILEAPVNLYLSGAAGIARLIQAGAGLVDALSADGSVRQQAASAVADWASSAADELGASQSRKLKSEGVEFGRLVSSEDASVADMAGYLVTHPELFASKVGESVIPMLASGVFGRVAAAGVAQRAGAQLGGAAATPAAAAEIARMASVGGASAAVVTEAAQIAGGVYNETLQKGYDRDNAQRAAGTAFLGALAIGRLSGGGAAGAVATGRSGALKEGAKEFGEEYAQTWLESLAPAVATGENIDVQQANKEAVAGGLIGFGVGAGVGGVNSVMEFLTPKAQPNKPLKPSEARTTSIDRFGEMAAAFGLPEKALARAREAASNMPAGDVPAFLAKLADAYNQRGLFAKPLEPQALTELQAAIDGPPEAPEATPAPEAATAQAQAVDNIEATLRAAGALPDEAIPAAGLVDEPPQTASGRYTLSDAISADGPTEESVKLVVRPDGTAAIQRDNGDVIDVTNMIRAGFSPERAIAQSLGDDTTGANVRKAASESPVVEGEPINKRWTAFAPESGTLNIPRADMPQIAAEHRGALVNFLNARGIAHEMGEVDPADLKPTQGEFEPRKVASMIESAGEGRAATGRSILVSGDGFILDGHHQWKAALDTGRPLRVVRFDAPIQDLLRLAHQFPSSTVARGPRRQAEGAPDAGVQPELPDAAERVSGAGPDGPGADAGRAGVVGSVAADAQRPQPADPAPAAGGGERGVPAGRESGADGALTPATAPAAPAPQPRVIGSYGRTPKAATPIELRPNADGTLTPFDGKYPMLDFETGDPISLPADTTDAQAADAIRKAKAITDKDKWFGVKPDESNAAPAPSGGLGESSGGGTTPAPGAATNEQRAALRKRIDGVKALLGCLQS